MTIRQRFGRVSLLSCLALLVIVVSACGGAGSAPASQPAKSTQPQAAASSASSQPSAASSASAKPAPSAPPQLGKLTIVISGHSLTQGATYVAVDQGFFKQEGFTDVEFVETGGGPKAVAAIIGGSGDMISVGFDDIAQAAKSGQNLVALALTYGGFPIQVTVRKDILDKKGVTAQSDVATKIQSLKGLKIGITGPGGSMDRTMREILQSQNINPDRDVELVSLGVPASILAAMQNGSIDATDLSNPQTAQIVVQSGGVVLLDLARGDLPQYKGLIYNVVALRKGDLKDKPEKALAIARAMVKAHQFVLSNKDAARASMEKFFPKIDPKVFLEAYNEEYAAGTITGDPTINDELAKKTLIWGAKADVVKVEDVVDRTFIEKAKQSIGR